MKYSTFDFSDLGRIKLNGRCRCDSGALVLSWCGSGFEFDFEGDGFIVSFGEYAGDVPAYLRVYADGVSQRFALVNGEEKICFDNMGSGRHSVRILRITEGVDLIRVTAVTLTGDEPYLLGRPADRPVKLEFYGDSITCGYGVMGNEQSPGYVTFEQDSTQAYAFMTSELLGADGRYMCESGKGIVANCMGDRSDMKVSEFWKWRTTDKDIWDFRLWTPDAVIINCGTNDAWGGVSDEEFTSAAVDMLRGIRAAYPSAKILWAYGIMDESKIPAITDAVGRFGDKDTFFMRIASMNSLPGEVGGGGHPNTVTSRRASALLADRLRGLLGI